MTIVRDRMNRWVEDSGMLADISEMDGEPEDNLFIMERQIECKTEEIMSVYCLY